MIDTVGYGYKPRGYEFGKIKPRLQASDKVVSISLEGLLEKVEKGYTISPAVMKGIKAGDFLRQQIFVVDIDNDVSDKPILNVEEALRICKDKSLPAAFHYHTFSSKDDKPKFRLGFVMDEVIDDHRKRETIQTALIGLFEQADQSCKNADRMFLGTNKKAVLVDKEARITLESIYAAYKPIIKQRQKMPQNSELERLKSEFDLFGLMQERNGDYKTVGNGFMFNYCELCTHSGDLMYYPSTNTFWCFHLQKGGSIIDYLMMSENIDVKAAINRLYSLSGVERPTKPSYTSRQSVVGDDDLLKRLTEFKPEVNYSADDIGFGRLFADVHKNIARYSTTVKEWFVFNGKAWVIDLEGMEVRGFAKVLCDTLLIYGASLKDGSDKKDFVNWASKYTNLGKREAMIKDARNEYYFTKSDMDKDIYAFNCQNGTLNLKTFEFKPHNPEDLLSKISNVIYDPNAKSERWIEFINEVMQGDTDKIRYLQKLFGYSLTGLTELEQCFILYGSTTRNGKSTMVETFGCMLGNTDGYALTIAPETLAIKLNKDSRGHSTDVARLKGCRFVNASEPPARMMLDAALVKNWCGGDTITAREIFEKQTEFKPTFKLFMNTNYLPQVQDQTLFSSKRINVITFDRHFTPEEQDMTLKATLRTPDNISGIFNWCLDGLKAYYAEGAAPPKTVTEANDDYRAGSDKIGQFVNECLIKTPGKHEKAGTIYETYCGWCDECGLHTLNKNNFFEELKSRKLMGRNKTVRGRTETNVILNHSINDEACKPSDNAPF